MLIPRVIREPAELVLDSLRQRRLVHMRVLRLLACELAVEVRYVQHGFLHIICMSDSNERIIDDRKGDVRRWV